MNHNSVWICFFQSTLWLFTLQLVYFINWLKIVKSHLTVFTSVVFMFCLLVLTQRSRFILAYLLLVVDLSTIRWDNISLNFDLRTWFEFAFTTESDIVLLITNWHLWLRIYLESNLYVCLNYLFFTLLVTAQLIVLKLFEFILDSFII